MAGQKLHTSSSILRPILEWAPTMLLVGGGGPARKNQDEKGKEGLGFRGLLDDGKTYWWEGYVEFIMKVKNGKLNSPFLFGTSALGRNGIQASLLASKPSLSSTNQFERCSGLSFASFPFMNKTLKGGRISCIYVSFTHPSVGRRSAYIAAVPACISWADPALIFRLSLLRWWQPQSQNSTRVPRAFWFSPP